MDHRLRLNFPRDHRDLLEDYFHKDKYCKSAALIEIMEKTGLEKRQVRDWFLTKRKEEKKKKLRQAVSNGAPKPIQPQFPVTFNPSVNVPPSLPIQIVPLNFLSNTNVNGSTPFVGSVNGPALLPANVPSLNGLDFSSMQPMYHSSEVNVGFVPNDYLKSIQTSADIFPFSTGITANHTNQLPFSELLSGNSIMQFNNSYGFPTPSSSNVPQSSTPGLLDISSFGIGEVVQPDYSAFGMIQNLPHFHPGLLQQVTPLQLPVIQQMDPQEPIQMASSSHVTTINDNDNNQMEGNKQ